MVILYILLATLIIILLVNWAIKGPARKQSAKGLPSYAISPEDVARLKDPKKGNEKKGG